MKIIGKVLIALSIVGAYIMLIMVQQTFPSFKMLGGGLLCCLVLSAILYAGTWLLEEAKMRDREKARASKERRARMAELEQAKEKLMSMDDRFMQDLQALDSDNGRG